MSVRQYPRPVYPHITEELTFPCHYGTGFEYEQDDTDEWYLRRQIHETLRELLDIQLRSSGGTRS